MRLSVSVYLIPLGNKFLGDIRQHHLLSKPQPQHNTTVGFDMKMTVQTAPPPTETFQPLLDQIESYKELPWNWHLPVIAYRQLRRAAHPGFFAISCQLALSELTL